MNLDTKDLAFIYFIVIDPSKKGLHTSDRHVVDARGLGSIPRPVKSAQCRLRLATAATFLQSCVAQTLSCGDGPRHLLHASA